MQNNSIWEDDCSMAAVVGLISFTLLRPDELPSNGRFSHEPAKGDVCSFVRLGPSWPGALVGLAGHFATERQDDDDER
jgi:hypothetical protein